MLLFLKYIAGGATIITGLVSLFWPLKVRGFTGLEVKGGRGITEIRSILGALFIGLGATALYFNQLETYLMLGITYLIIAVVRGISMIVDKSIEASNTISLVAEIVLGAILIL